MALAGSRILVLGPRAKSQNLPTLISGRLRACSTAPTSHSLPNLPEASTLPLPAQSSGDLSPPQAPDFTVHPSSCSGLQLSCAARNVSVLHGLPRRSQRSPGASHVPADLLEPSVPVLCEDLLESSLTRASC